VVLALDNPIHPRVVGRDANVTDAISVSQPVKCSYVCSAIIGDYLLDSSLMAENLLENKLAEGVTCLIAKCVPFGPSS
jgi:hypothetical protein